MSVSEAQKRATMKYKTEKMKRVPLDLQKEFYADIQQHAAARGESVNGFIKRAITETMERDSESQE